MRLNVTPRNHAAALALWCASLCAGGAHADSVALQAAIDTLRAKPSATVRGALLTNTKALAAFYERGAMSLAWSRPGAIDELRRAIRTAEGDGLRAVDYHLAALEGAVAAKDVVSADLIASEALIRLLAHLRYGKVNPARLERTWNHPARLDEAELDTMLDAARSAPSLERAIDVQRPKHFVYEGLRRALERYRKHAETGWPVVRLAGKLRPGSQDDGVPGLRARLRATGEWNGNEAELSSTIYDEALVAAVKAFQAQHRLREDGVIGKTTLEALNVTAQARMTQIRVNLERARWVLGGFGSTFLLVNLPAYKAYLIRNGSLEWDTRVQIGKAARKTPAFRTNVTAVAFNPTWTVPPTILTEDVVPALTADPGYLEQHNLVVTERATGSEVDPAEVDWSNANLADYRFTQPAGRGNALGQVKFLMDNPYSIFLHDTPKRELFAADQRLFSSGCIRVEHPLELAQRLLPSKWTPELIDSVLQAGKTRTVPVDPPMPVAIVYWTASISTSGRMRFARDAYDYDRQVAAALDAPVTGPVWWPAAGKR